MTRKPFQYRQPILQFLISTHSYRFFAATHVSFTHPFRKSYFYYNNRSRNCFI